MIVMPPAGPLCGPSALHHLADPQSRRRGDGPGLVGAAGGRNPGGRGIVAEPGAETAARAAIDAASGGVLPYRPNLIRHDPPTPEEIALLRGFDPARAILA